MRDIFAKGEEETVQRNTTSANEIQKSKWKGTFYSLHQMILTMNISCSRLLQRACLFSLIIRKAILSSDWFRRRHKPSDWLSSAVFWLAELVIQVFETVRTAEQPFPGLTTSQTWLRLWTPDLKLNPTRILVIRTHNLMSESGRECLLITESNMIPSVVYICL